MPRLQQLEYVLKLMSGVSAATARRILVPSAATVLLFLLVGGFIVPSASPQQLDPFEEAFSLTDGDSAIVALVEAAQANPDHPRAPEALLRAGFLAYVKGEFSRAGELFGMAQEAGAPEAWLWRGLSLLSEGKTTDAAACLREGGSGEGEAAALALAACAFIEGDLRAGEAKCKEVIDAGGVYAVAASLLLRRTVPGALDPEENDRWAKLLAERQPLSYEAVLAERLPRPEPEGAAVEEEILEEESAAAETGVDDEDAAGAGGDQSGARGGQTLAGDDAVSAKEFCVQVGAFADERNAQALFQDLSSKGYAEVRIESEARRGTLFHCVRVGRFASRDEALTQARVLERDEGLGTQVMENKRQAPRE